METRKQVDGQVAAQETTISASRRATLRRLGRFAVITAPAVTLLLAAKAKPAHAVAS